MLVWLGHASFMIAGEQRIYVDPCYVKKGSPAADIILLTHRHINHFSVPDILLIIQPETLVISNAALIASPGISGFRTAELAPGGRIVSGGTEVLGVAAYTPDASYHGREENGLGFIVTARGKRIYHAGDTGLIPEIQDIGCDVALFPVSGGSVMSADEAAEAAAVIRPSLALPMHYGSSSGTIADARRFCSLCTSNGVAAKLLTPY